MRTLKPVPHKVFAIVDRAICEHLSGRMLDTARIMESLNVEDLMQRRDFKEPDGEKEEPQQRMAWFWADDEHTSSFGDRDGGTRSLYPRRCRTFR
jgi:hypothetical protein